MLESSILEDFKARDIIIAVDQGGDEADDEPGAGRAAEQDPGAAGRPQEELLRRSDLQCGIRPCRGRREYTTIT